MVVKGAPSKIEIYWQKLHPAQIGLLTPVKLTSGQYSIGLLPIVLDA